MRKMEKMVVRGEMRGMVVGRSPGLFWSRKWPSEASNHHFSRCATLVKAAPYGAR